MEANEPAAVYVDVAMFRFTVDPANDPADPIESSQRYINRLKGALKRRWPNAQIGVTASAGAQEATIDIRPPEADAVVKNEVESIMKKLFRQGGFWAY